MDVKFEFESSLKDLRGKTERLVDKIKKVKKSRSILSSSFSVSGSFSEFDFDSSNSLFSFFSIFYDLDSFVSERKKRDKKKKRELEKFFFKIVGKRKEREKSGSSRIGKSKDLELDYKKNRERR